MTLPIWAAVACALAQAPVDPFPDRLEGLKLAKPEDGVDAPSTQPPAGAVVLFDGKSLDGWVHRNGGKPGAWKLATGGALQVVPGTSDLLSKFQIDGPVRLHVEFRTPYMPGDKGQGRGNSGVYLQGRYEVQVLDSYGIEKPGEGDCGGIYGIAKPLVNACKAPATWQAYDIDFVPPVFADGKKVAPGIISVRLNGVVIHDKVIITKDNTTSGLGGDPSTPGPLLLQDHGNPAQYRNIWLVKKKEK